MPELPRKAERTPVWPWIKNGTLKFNRISDNYDWPRISIVTPSYNQGNYLEATIQSVLNQGYPNLEYIIIDGDSNDNSVEIIRKYDSYIKYWVSEPDNGQYAAINKGFRHATGDIYAWINSDDLYCPWAFRTVGSVFMQLRDVRWLSTLSPLTWDMQSYCSAANHLTGFSKSAFLDGCYLPGNKVVGGIQQESTFWRSDLWKTAGGLREKLWLAGDFDLWARFYNYVELYGIASPLAGFRQHAKQRSLDTATYYRQAKKVLSEMRDSHKYSESSFPLVRKLLLKIPNIRILSENYYQKKNNNYTGKYIVATGRSIPQKWKIIESGFSAEIRSLFVK